MKDLIYSILVLVHYGAFLKMSYKVKGNIFLTLQLGFTRALGSSKPPSQPMAEEPLQAPAVHLALGIVRLQGEQAAELSHLFGLEEQH